MGSLPWRGAAIASLGSIHDEADGEGRMLQQLEFLQESLPKLQPRSGITPEARAALLQALEHGTQAVGLFDAADRLVYANRLFRDAWAVETLDGTTFRSMISFCHANRCGAVVASTSLNDWLSRATQRRREGPVSRAFEVDFWDGRWFWVSEFRTEDGWILSLGQDITPLKKSQRRLSLARDDAVKASLTDPLTQLPNRRGATERLEQMIDDGMAFSVALIDLVHFKQINDSYGHAVGDAVLVEFARRLLESVPRGCTAARLAGDEFAVIGSPGLSAEMFRLVATEILAGQRKPFDVMGYSLEVGISIGIASVPTDAKRVGELLSAADEAMYTAKQSNRYSVRSFDPQMGETRREQAALRRDLQDAFARRQFIPCYQPVVDLRTGALIKFEMLARWAHPKRGLLTPDRFLPVFTTMEQWNQLTLELLREAGDDFSGIKPFPRIAFNVSAQQLKRDSLVSIFTALKEALPLDRLEMEVTESALISNPSDAREAVDAARALGLSTALDDFGVGFSSLKHLREIPFDRLKLDRSFVQDIIGNPRNQIFVGAIIDLAKKLGLSVIVEGVEDQRTADALAELGCHYGQGYLYGRPMPAGAARKLLLERPENGSQPASTAAVL